MEPKTLRWLTFSILLDHASSEIFYFIVIVEESTSIKLGIYDMVGCGASLKKIRFDIHKKVFKSWKLMSKELQLKFDYPKSEWDLRLRSIGTFFSDRDQIGLIPFLVGKRIV